MGVALGAGIRVRVGTAVGLRVAAAVGAAAGVRVAAAVGATAGARVGVAPPGPHAIAPMPIKSSDASAGAIHLLRRVAADVFIRHLRIRPGCMQASTGRGE